MGIFLPVTIDNCLMFQKMPNLLDFDKTSEAVKKFYLLTRHM